MIYSSFVTTYDVNFPFFSQTFRHNGIAVFGTMPPMCRSCPDVNKLRGMDTTILGQHRPLMSIKSLVQHSGWQKMVSLCSLIRLIGVCADRDQPEFLCSRSDSRNLEVHVATAAVFEIAWWTGARDQQKQRRSSKTPVYAGPKDQQLVLFFFCFFQIHIAQIMFKTHFKVQNSLVI